MSNYAHSATWIAGALLAGCGGSGDGGSAPPSDAPAPPAMPVITLTAAPSSIVAGGASTLTWSATNATSCTANDAWTGSQATSGKTTVTLKAAGSYTYGLNCTGAGGSSTASASLTVTDPPQALAALSTDSLTFADQIVGSPSVPQTVTLSNMGTAPLSGIAVATTGVADFKVSSSCGTALPAAASCSIQVIFTPSAAGTRSGQLMVASNNPGGPLSVGLSGIGTEAGTPAAVLTPGTLVFPKQATGTISPAQTMMLANYGSATLGNIVVSISGDFAETGTCGATLAPTATCALEVTFQPTAAGARAGTISIASNNPGGSVTASLSGSGTSAPVANAMPLISTGVPIVASSSASPAGNADDASYDTTWRSSGVPATLALDLSGVPAAQRQNIWLVWYNDDTYGYDHALIGQPGYNNAGTYVLEGNPGAGGGAAPVAGWITLASVARNTLHSYTHFVNFANMNWVRLNVNAADGSAGNSDIALNVDIYGAINGVTDGWFFNGDSITANCMGHGSINGENQYQPGSNILIAAPSFGQQVNALVGNDTPLQENAGMPGFTSGQMTAYLAGWLAHVPSRYVTLNLGTNDAAAGSPSAYFANMQQLVKTVIAVGKVPVIPTIPYSTEPMHLANIPALNAEVRALYAAYPAIIPGPDLWTYFKDNPGYLSSDHVHPNAQGCAAYRTVWARFAAASVYAR